MESEIKRGNYTTCGTSSPYQVRIMKKRCERKSGKQVSWGDEMPGAQQIGGSLASFKRRFPVSPTLIDHAMFGTLGFWLEVIIMGASFCSMEKIGEKPYGGGAHL